MVFNVETQCVASLQDMLQRKIVVFLGRVLQTFVIEGQLFKVKVQPTPVFLPGESQGQGSMVG